MTSHPLSSSLSTTLSTLSSSPKPTLYYYRCSLPSSTSSATSWTHFQTKLVVELSDYIPEEDPQKETEKEKEKENEDVRFETLSSIHHPPLALDRTHPLNEKKRNKRRSSTSTKTKIPTEKEKKASIPFPWSSSSRRRYLKKNELDSFHLMPRNGSILVKIRINCNEVLGHQVDSLKQHIHDQVSTSMLQFLHHGVHSIVHLPETTSPAEFEPSSLSTSCDSFVNLTTTSPSKRSHKKNKNSESMVYSNTFKFHFHSSMHWIAPFTPPSPHRATTSSSCHQMKPLYLSYLQVHSLTLHIQVNFQGPSSLPAPAPAPTPLHRRVPLSYFMLDPCSFQHDWQPYFLNLIHQCCWLLPSLFSTKYVQSLHRTTHYVSSILNSMKRISKRSDISSPLHQMDWNKITTKYFQTFLHHQKPKRVVRLPNSTSMSSHPTLTTTSTTSTKHHSFLSSSNTSRTYQFEEDVFEALGFEDLFMLSTSSSSTFHSSSTPSSISLSPQSTSFLSIQPHESPEMQFEEDLFSLPSSSHSTPNATFPPWIIMDHPKEKKDSIEGLLSRIQSIQTQCQQVFESIQSN